MSDKVVQFKRQSEITAAKIVECIRTKTVYVNVISQEQLVKLNAKGFTVIMK